MLQLRFDLFQRVTPAWYSETSFNVAPLTWFLPLKVKLLFADRGIFRRFCQAVGCWGGCRVLCSTEDFPRAVYSIRKHTFGIVAVDFAVGFHWTLERMGFIEEFQLRNTILKKPSMLLIPTLASNSKSPGTVLLDSFCEWKKSTRTVPGDF